MLLVGQNPDHSIINIELGNFKKNKVEKICKLVINQLKNIHFQYQISLTIVNVILKFWHFKLIESIILRFLYKYISIINF
jgi:hypothetical protein